MTYTKQYFTNDFYLMRNIFDIRKADSETGKGKLTDKNYMKMLLKLFTINYHERKLHYVRRIYHIINDCAVRIVNDPNYGRTTMAYKYLQGNILVFSESITDYFETDQNVQDQIIFHAEDHLDWIHDFFNYFFQNEYIDHEINYKLFLYETFLLLKHYRIQFESIDVPPGEMYNFFYFAIMEKIQIEYRRFIFISEELKLIQVILFGLENEDKVIESQMNKRKIPSNFHDNIQKIIVSIDRNIKRKFDQHDPDILGLFPTIRQYYENPLPY